MGREILIKLKKVDKSGSRIDCEDFVCGRDDATNYIAQQVYNKRENLPDVDEDNLEGEALSDRYSLIYNLNDSKDWLALSDLCNVIAEYAYRDSLEIRKAKDALEDLREARRHCSVYDEFMKFSEAMDNTQQWIDDEGFSRAAKINSVISTYREKADDNLKNDVNYYIIIELSE